jgi:hypothetical protein
LVTPDLNSNKPQGFVFGHLQDRAGQDTVGVHADNPVHGYTAAADEPRALKLTRRPKLVRSNLCGLHALRASRCCAAHNTRFELVDRHDVSGGERENAQGGLVHLLR